MFEPNNNNNNSASTDSLKNKQYNNVYLAPQETNEDYALINLDRNSPFVHLGDTVPANSVVFTNNPVFDYIDNKIKKSKLKEANYDHIQLEEHEMVITRDAEEERILNEAKLNTKKLLSKTKDKYTPFDEYNFMKDTQTARQEAFVQNIDLRDWDEYTPDKDLTFLQNTDFETYMEENQHDKWNVALGNFFKGFTKAIIEMPTDMVDTIQGTVAMINNNISDDKIEFWNASDYTNKINSLDERRIYGASFMQNLVSSSGRTVGYIVSSFIEQAALLALTGGAGNALSLSTKAITTGSKILRPYLIGSMKRFGHALYSGMKTSMINSREVYNNVYEDLKRKQTREVNTYGLSLYSDDEIKQMATKAQYKNVTETFAINSLVSLATYSMSMGKTFSKVGKNRVAHYNQIRNDMGKISFANNATDFLENMIDKGLSKINNKVVQRGLKIASRGFTEGLEEAMEEFFIERGEKKGISEYAGYNYEEQEGRILEAFTHAFISGGIISNITSSFSGVAKSLDKAYDAQYKATVDSMNEMTQKGLEKIQSSFAKYVDAKKNFEKSSKSDLDRVKYELEMQQALQDYNINILSSGLHMFLFAYEYGYTTAGDGKTNIGDLVSEQIGVMATQLDLAIKYLDENTTEQEKQEITEQLKEMGILDENGNEMIPGQLETIIKNNTFLLKNQKRIVKLFHDFLENRSADKQVAYNYVHYTLFKETIEEYKKKDEKKYERTEQTIKRFFNENLAKRNVSIKEKQKNKKADELQDFYDKLTKHFIDKYNNNSKPSDEDLDNAIENVKKQREIIATYNDSVDELSHEKADAKVYLEEIETFLSYLEKLKASKLQLNQTNQTALNSNNDKESKGQQQIATIDDMNPELRAEYQAVTHRYKEAYKKYQKAMRRLKTAEINMTGEDMSKYLQLMAVKKHLDDLKERAERVKKQKGKDSEKREVETGMSIESLYSKYEEITHEKTIKELNELAKKYDLNSYEDIEIDLSLLDEDTRKQYQKYLDTISNIALAHYSKYDRHLNFYEHGINQVKDEKYLAQITIERMKYQLTSGGIKNKKDLEKYAEDMRSHLVRRGVFGYGIEKEFDSMILEAKNIIDGQKILEDEEVQNAKGKFLKKMWEKTKGVFKKSETQEDNKKAEEKKEEEEIDEEEETGGNNGFSHEGEHGDDPSITHPKNPETPPNDEGTSTTPPKTSESRSRKAQRFREMFKDNIYFSPRNYTQEEKDNALKNIEKVLTEDDEVYESFRNSPTKRDNLKVLVLGIYNGVKEGLNNPNLSLKEYLLFLAENSPQTITSISGSIEGHLDILAELSKDPDNDIDFTGEIIDVLEDANFLRQLFNKSINNSFSSNETGNFQHLEELREQLPPELPTPPTNVEEENSLDIIEEQNEEEFDENERQVNLTSAIHAPEQIIDSNKQKKNVFNLNDTTNTESLYTDGAIKPGDNFEVRSIDDVKKLNATPINIKNKKGEIETVTFGQFKKMNGIPQETTLKNLDVMVTDPALKQKFTDNVPMFAFNDNGDIMFAVHNESFYYDRKYKDKTDEESTEINEKKVQKIRDLRKAVSEGDNKIVVTKRMTGKLTRIPDDGKAKESEKNGNNRIVLIGDGNGGFFYYKNGKTETVTFKDGEHQYPSAKGVVYSLRKAIGSDGKEIQIPLPINPNNTNAGEQLNEEASNTISYAMLALYYRNIDNYIKAKQEQLIEVRNGSTKYKNVTTYSIENDINNVKLALNNIVGTMLGVKPDNVTNEHLKKASKKSRNIITYIESIIGREGGSQQGENLGKFFSAFLKMNTPENFQNNVNSEALDKNNNPVIGVGTVHLAWDNGQLIIYKKNKFNSKLKVSPISNKGNFLATYIPLQRFDVAYDSETLLKKSEAVINGINSGEVRNFKAGVSRFNLSGLEGKGKPFEIIDANGDVVPYKKLDRNGNVIANETATYEDFVVQTHTTNVDSFEVKKSDGTTMEVTYTTPTVTFELASKYNPNDADKGKKGGKKEGDGEGNNNPLTPPNPDPTPEGTAGQNNPKTEEEIIQEKTDEEILQRNQEDKLSINDLLTHPDIQSEIKEFFRLNEDRLAKFSFDKAIVNELIDKLKFFKKQYDNGVLTAQEYSDSIVKFLLPDFERKVQEDNMQSDQEWMVIVKEYDKVTNGIGFSNSIEISKHLLHTVLKALKKKIVETDGKISTKDIYQEAIKSFEVLSLRQEELKGVLDTQIKILENITKKEGLSELTEEEFSQLSKEQKDEYNTIIGEINSIKEKIEVLKSAQENKYHFFDKNSPWGDGGLLDKELKKFFGAFIEEEKFELSEETIDQTEDVAWQEQVYKDISHEINLKLKILLSDVPRGSYNGGFSYTSLGFVNNNDLSSTLRALQRVFSKNLGQMKSKEDLFRMLKEEKAPEYSAIAESLKDITDKDFNNMYYTFSAKELDNITLLYGSNPKLISNIPQKKNFIILENLTNLINTKLTVDGFFSPELNEILINTIKHRIKEVAGEDSIHINKNGLIAFPRKGISSEVLYQINSVINEELGLNLNPATLKEISKSIGGDGTTLLNILNHLYSMNSEAQKELEIYNNNLIQKEDMKFYLGNKRGILSKPLKKAVSSLSKLNSQFLINDSSTVGRANGKTFSSMLRPTASTQRNTNLLDDQYVEKKSQTIFAKNNPVLKLLKENPEQGKEFVEGHITVENVSQNSLTLEGIKKESIRDLSKLDEVMLRFSHYAGSLGGNLINIDGVEYFPIKVIGPTISNKKNIYIYGTLGIPLSNQISVSINDDGVKEIVYDDEQGIKKITEDIFNSEFDRIVRVMIENKKKINDPLYETNLPKGYEDAGSLFLTIPKFNTITFANNEGEETSFLSAMMGIIHQITDSNPSEELLKTIYEQLDSIRQYGINQAVEIVKENVQSEFEFLLENKAILSAKDSITSLSGQKQDYDVLLASYVLNNLYSQHQISQLYSNDLANYGVSFKKFFKKMGMDAPKDSLDAINKMLRNSNLFNEYVKFNLSENHTKRLANTSAPGNIINFPADMQEYNQIMIDDTVAMTGVIEYYTHIYGEGKYTEKGRTNKKVADEIFELKEQIKSLRQEYNSGKNEVYSSILEAENKLDKLFNELKTANKNSPLVDFLELDSTDAQEYMTWKEYVDTLLYSGEINQEQYDEISESIKKNGYPPEQYKEMFLPQKPVYTGEIFQDSWFSREVYIKSSSIVLLPSITKGLALDGLRQNMERLQEHTGRNVRASYQSANKLGEIQKPFTFDELSNPNMPIEELEKSYLKLDRQYFKIQLNVVSDHTYYTTQGSQMFKILMSSGISQDDTTELHNPYQGYKSVAESLGVDVSGKFTGNTLNELAQASFQRMKEIKAEQLRKRLGLDKDADDSVLLQIKDLLLEEAILRGFNQNIIDSLAVIKNGSDFNEFLVPLFFNESAPNFEALLQSIITKGFLKTKLPGKLNVVASSEGFYEKTTLDNLSKEERGNIVWLDPNRKPGQLRSTTIGESGIVESEVLVSSFIYRDVKDKNGKIRKERIDLTKYAVRDQKTGNLYLDTSKIDLDGTLLSNFSYRTPTSAHNSGAILKVVGFLPNEMEDVLIVPPDHSKLIGEDYDIDKRTFYSLHHFTTTDSDGKLSVKQLNSENQDEYVFTMEGDLIENIANFYSENQDEGLRVLSTIMRYEDIPDVNNLLLYLSTQNTELSKENTLFLESKFKELGVNSKEVFDKKGNISIKTKYVEDTATIEKNRERAKKEVELKILENIQVNAYKSVFLTNDKKIQSLIGKKLSFDLSKETSEIIHNIKTSKELKNDKTFSIYDTSHQSAQMDVGNSSLIGTSIYSANLVFNAILQRKGGVEVESLKIGDFQESNRVGITHTLRQEGNTKHVVRTTSEAFTEAQNRAVDAMKAFIMEKINENSNTMDVYTMFMVRGISDGVAKVTVKDKSGLLTKETKEVTLYYPAVFMSQPAITKLTKILDDSNSVYSEEGKLYWNDVVDGLLLEYAGKLKDKSILKDAMDKDGNIDAEKLHKILMKPNYTSFITLQNLVDNLVDGVNSEEAILQQMISLSLFRTLKLESSEFSDARGVISLDSKGLGKSVIRTIALKKKLEKAREGKYKDVVDSEINEAYLTKVSLEMSEKLSLSLFPYETELVNMLIDEFINFDTSIEKVENDFYKLMQDFKTYLFTHESFGLSQGDPTRFREMLFFDKGGNESLASYLNRVRYKELGQFDFFKELSLHIKTNGEPSIIKKENSIKKKNTSTDHIELSALFKDKSISLPDWNGRKMDGRKLVELLTAYSYLNNGEYGAIGFSESIPVNVLKELGIDVKLRNLYNQTFYFKEPTQIFKDFKKQYIQHNPHLAKNVNNSNIESVNGIEGKNISDDTQVITLKENFKDDFIKIKNGKDFILFERIGDEYHRISKLGTFGFNEYSMLKPVEHSLVLANRQVKRESQPNLLKDIIESEGKSVSDYIHNNTPLSEQTSILIKNGLLETDSILHKIIKKMSEDGNSPNIVISDAQGLAGKYSLRSHEISIGKELFKNKPIHMTKDEFFMEVFTEEVIHSATAKTMRSHYTVKGKTYTLKDNVPLYARRINRLYETAKKHYDNLPQEKKDLLSKEVAYYLEDPIEFIAGVFVNQDFKNFLNSIDVSKANDNVKGKSLLHKIAEAIKNFIIHFTGSTYTEVTQEAVEDIIFKRTDDEILLRERDKRMNLALRIKDNITSASILLPEERVEIRKMIAIGNGLLDKYEKQFSSGKKKKTSGVPVSYVENVNGVEIDLFRSPFEGDKDGYFYATLLTTNLYDDDIFYKEFKDKAIEKIKEGKFLNGSDFQSDIVKATIYDIYNSSVGSRVVLPQQRLEVLEGKKLSEVVQGKSLRVVATSLPKEIGSRVEFVSGEYGIYFDNYNIQLINANKSEYVVEVNGELVGKIKKDKVFVSDNGTYHFNLLEDSLLKSKSTTYKLLATYDPNVDSKDEQNFIHKVQNLSGLKDFLVFENSNNPKFKEEIVKMSVEDTIEDVLNKYIEKVGVASISNNDLENIFKSIRKLRVNKNLGRYALTEQHLYDLKQKIFLQHSKINNNKVVPITAQVKDSPYISLLEKHGLFAETHTADNKRLKPTKEDTKYIATPKFEVNENELYRVVSRVNLLPQNERPIVISVVKNLPKDLDNNIYYYNAEDNKVYVSKNGSPVEYKSINKMLKNGIVLHTDGTVTKDSLLFVDSILSKVGKEKDDKVLDFILSEVNSESLYKANQKGVVKTEDLFRVKNISAQQVYDILIGKEKGFEEQRKKVFEMIKNGTLTRIHNDKNGAGKVLQYFNKNMLITSELISRGTRQDIINTFLIQEELTQPNLLGSQHKDTIEAMSKLENNGKIVGTKIKVGNILKHTLYEVTGVDSEGNYELKPLKDVFDFKEPDSLKILDDSKRKQILDIAYGLLTNKGDLEIFSTRPKEDIKYIVDVLKENGVEYTFLRKNTSDVFNDENSMLIDNFMRSKKSAGIVILSDNIVLTDSLKKHLSTLVGVQFLQVSSNPNLETKIQEANKTIFEQQVDKVLNGENLTRVTTENRGNILVRDNMTDSVLTAVFDNHPNSIVIVENNTNIKNLNTHIREILGKDKSITNKETLEIKIPSEYGVYNNVSIIRKSSKSLKVFKELNESIKDLSLQSKEHKKLFEHVKKNIEKLKGNDTIHVYEIKIGDKRVRFSDDENILILDYISKDVGDNLVLPYYGFGSKEFLIDGEKVKTKGSVNYGYAVKGTDTIINKKQNIVFLGNQKEHKESLVKSLIYTENNFIFADDKIKVDIEKELATDLGNTKGIKEVEEKEVSPKTKKSSVEKLRANNKFYGTPRNKLNNIKLC